jgi:hypothetical protein
MNFLRKLGFVSLATLSIAAVGGASSASATTFEINGKAANYAFEFTATLATGASFIIKDEFGTTTDTCSGSTIRGQTQTPYTAGTVSGSLSSLSFASCNHTTHVLNRGSFYTYWTSGTNGVFGSKEAEVTLLSTSFGASATCKTGTGSALGTITGFNAGHASIHVNALINCGILGNASWTGTYTVTSPTGLGVVN